MGRGGGGRGSSREQIPPDAHVVRDDGAARQEDVLRAVQLRAPRDLVARFRLDVGAEGFGAGGFRGHLVLGGFGRGRGWGGEGRGG